MGAFSNQWQENRTQRGSMDREWQDGADLVGSRFALRTQAIVEAGFARAILG